MPEHVGQDRYAAPVVPLEIASPPPQMRKPVIVWISQIIAIYYVITTMVEVIRRLLRFRSMFQDDVFAWGILLGIGLLLLVVGLLIVMVIQLQRRSPVGRWLAVALVAFMMIAGAVNLPSLSKHGLDARAWGLMGLVGGVYALFGWWLYLVGFSRKARAWFTKTAQSADPSAPR